MTGMNKWEGGRRRDHTIITTERDKAQITWVGREGGGGKGRRGRKGGREGGREAEGRGREGDTLLAAELVMSIHVSAALCQNTPTVLLQLGLKERSEEERKERGGEGGGGGRKRGEEEKGRRGEGRGEKEKGRRGEGRGEKEERGGSESAVAS